MTASLFFLIVAVAAGAGLAVAHWPKSPHGQYLAWRERREAEGASPEQIGMEEHMRYVEVRLRRHLSDAVLAAPEHAERLFEEAVAFHAGEVTRASGAQAGRSFAAACHEIGLRRMLYPDALAAATAALPAWARSEAYVADILSGKSKPRPDPDFIAAFRD